uniref:(northern house mosquito) hypothetical protein n=1 Tax=Culex pipiens TaxID=7175 RepID=A0A8D8BZQ0_CULPI
MRPGRSSPPSGLLQPALHSQHGIGTRGGDDDVLQALIVASSTSLLTSSSASACFDVLIDAQLARSFALSRSGTCCRFDVSGGCLLCSSKRLHAVDVCAGCV